MSHPMKSKPTTYCVMLPDYTRLPPMTADQVISACKERKLVTSAAKVSESKAWWSETAARPIRDYPEFAPHVWDLTLEDAQHNPPADAECTLFMRGQQEGPFLPSQIRAMWKAGSITSDALFYYPQLPDWRPVRLFCEISNTDNVSSSGTDFTYFVGVLLTIVGIALTIYFAGFYDTSIKTDGGASVVNLSKQQNRLIGVIVGIAISAGGVLMVCLPNKPYDT